MEVRKSISDRQKKIQFELVSEHVELISQHVELVSQHVEILPFNFNISTC